MRIANIAGKAHLVSGDLALDVETASDGAYGPTPEAVYADWKAFSAWANGVDVEGHSAARAFEVTELDAVVTRPAQIIAIGLNYAEHAKESNLALPEHPVVFTKFASSLAGADADVKLFADTVDWEVELVAVVGVGGRGISEADAWDHIAGLTVGQDISERTTQTRGPAPQFSLGKSFENYAPVGPWVVSTDELAASHDLDNLALSCTVSRPDGTEEVLQDGRTDDLIFSIPQLVARLSEVLELIPGDLIFTGTPKGVGMGRDPKVYLQPGETLTTTVEGIGSITQRFVEA